MSSWPITSWHRWNNQNCDRLYFLRLWNHCRWYCSHEIKRCLLLGRKAMTNVDSILKRRDITLPKEVCLLKAVVFPVVMYGCGLWRKLSAKELMLFDCSVGEVSWEPVGLQGDPTSPSKRKSVLNIHWKDGCWSWNSPYFGPLMWRTDSLEKTLMLRKIAGRRRRDWQRMRWLHGTTE